MRTTANKLRPWIRVSGLISLCIVIGVTIGILIWCNDLARKGKTIADGLQGKVEDGISLLQGLTALGGFVGAGVGLATSLVSTARRNSTSAHT
jgi:hypothetical protein